jgi:hypothetical protein
MRNLTLILSLMLLGNRKSVMNELDVLGGVLHGSGRCCYCMAAIINDIKLYICSRVSLDTSNVRKGVASGSRPPL